MLTLSIRFVAIFATTVFVLPETAWAYLDPGAASMVLQGIIGAMVAGLAVVPMFLGKVKEKARSLFSRVEKHDEK